MKFLLFGVTTLVGATCQVLFGQALPDLTVSAIDTALVSTNSQTLRISGVLRTMLTNVGTAGPVGRFLLLTSEDTNRNNRYDSGLVGILGSAEHVDPMAVGAKPVVLIPLFGIVAFRPVAE